ncbi:MAG: recombinase family protein [Shinella sp.]|nr:MAG: recombinase family protein [Shinella sp.]
MPALPRKWFKQAQQEAETSQGIRAYSYVRMSTQKQLKGDSLRRQLERSRQFADEHGLVLDESLRDIGVSAWKGKNFKSGALGHFLAMVERGEIPQGSFLLIESLDRLSREAVPDALTLFMAIINAGITIATLGDDRQIYSRDTLKGDWTKLIIGLAVMSRGHEESQTKSERISLANQRKRDIARQGKGKLTAKTPAWIDARRIEGQRYRFTLNQHANTVKLIFELAANGLGATAITSRLNADNIPAFQSKDGWYPGIVKMLLTREDVIGIFQPHRLENGERVPDGDPIDSYFPAVIDKDLYLRVQSLRRLTGNGGRKGKSFGNLFTGICSCAHCGGPMSIKMSRIGSGNVRYLACNNHVRGQRCKEGRKNFRYDLLEDAILTHVPEIGLADIVVLHDKLPALKELDETIAALTLELETIRRKEERLSLAIETADAPLEKLIEQLKVRQDERHALLHQLQDCRNRRVVLQVRQREIHPDADGLLRLRTAWNTAMDEDERFRLRSKAHAAIREIIYDISFDSTENVVTLVVANGISVYRFRNGVLIGHCYALAA